MMTNEQRAAEALKKIEAQCGDYVHQDRMHNYSDPIRQVILDSLNAATEEKDTRIKELEDALKPFAGYGYSWRNHACSTNNHVLLAGQGKTNRENKVTVGDFRNAAAVSEEG